jgi:hypothetical protein
MTLHYAVTPDLIRGPWSYKTLHVQMSLQDGPRIKSGVTVFWFSVLAVFGKSWKNVERAKGFEPSTPTLARSCSTPELRPLGVLEQVYLFGFGGTNKGERTWQGGFDPAVIFSSTSWQFIQNTPNRVLRDLKETRVGDFGYDCGG